MSSSCEFPLFRQKFFGGCSWIGADILSEPVAIEPPSEPTTSRPMSVGASAPTLTLQQIHRQNLRSLDLRALPREEGPPSESQARRQKFQYFEKRCSEVADGLFLGSDSVAKNRETLRENRVTHVVNCVGFLYPEYFKDEISYKTLYLQDTPGEDILCVLYDTFEFIDAARSTGGRVLVHCSQGVSRSATLAIGYLMWKLNQPYDEVYQHVKSIRGVANPNIGFTCQLLQWHKRRSTPPRKCRVYRVAPHCSANPLYLVPKIVASPRGCKHPMLCSLDPRGVFIIHTPAQIYIWKGAFSPDAFMRAAEYAVRCIDKYENTPHAALVVQQGEEPEELLTALRPSLDEALPMDTDTPPTSFTMAQSPFALGGLSLPSTPLPSDEYRPVSAGALPQVPCEVEEYSEDFEMYYRAAGGSAGSCSSGPSTRPATPRLPGGVSLDDSVTCVRPESPAATEGRCRKYRRSESERWDAELSRAKMKVALGIQRWPQEGAQPGAGEYMDEDGSLAGEPPQHTMSGGL